MSNTVTVELVLKKYAIFVVVFVEAAIDYRLRTQVSVVEKGLLFMTTIY